MGFVRITVRGQNVPAFKKKGSFSILLGRCLWVILETPLFHKRVPIKFCLGVKLGAKLHEILV